MSRILLVAIFLAGCAHQALVTTPGGKLIFAAGTVTAQRGNLVSLRPDDLVYEQHLVATDKRSRAQFLMNDGTMLALRPETRLFVEAYSDTTRQGYVLDLIQGGMRSISRGTGKNSIKTPAGTIGLGKAHYDLVWCDESCSQSGDAKVINGLYLGISEGVASINNNVGRHDLSAGQYVYLRDRNSRPTYLNMQPAALVDTDRTTEFGTEQAASEVNEILQELGGPLPTAPTRPK